MVFVVECRVPEFASVFISVSVRLESADESADESASDVAVAALRPCGG